MSNKEDKESGILYAVFTTVLLYFLFKITLIYTIVSDRHISCLSSHWDNIEVVITPFSAFLILAILSCIWLFLSCLKYKKKVGKAAYLIFFVAAVFYYFWFKGFYGFWLLIEYEQDKITLSQFFNQTGSDELFKLYEGHHEIQMFCQSYDHNSDKKSDN
ncbi:MULTISPECIES: hypothetical protein [Pseudoalteromonas]|uniref:Uncharacterized protein n=1 Tax=Pseudoalteromonas porphyrae TaxID=187330 RepID=A0A0N1EJA5_9GAMM|nr:hypothetical protein [Pseudoalteromonas porphyrae]KPH62946.1 hypothetical protein ADS77_11220 [Pseudoalteromonas porphyrae]